MPSFTSLALAASAATSVLAAGHASFPIQHRSVAGGNPRNLQKRAAGHDGALLANNSYTSYVIDLEIGTPSQLVSVSIDTGSSILWMNADCANAGNQPYCETMAQFNVDKSSSWRDLDQTSTISYGSGNASLVEGTDVVRIPANVDGTDMTIPKLQFGVASETYIVSAGILGVCFGEPEGLTTYPNIIDQLSLNNLTNGRVFSMALGNLTSTDAAGNGVIIFGGIDTKKFVGDLVPLPNLPEQKTDPYPMPRYWVTMESVTINGTDKVVPTNQATLNMTTTNTPITSPKLLANSSGPVIMDSGTSFMQLPSEFMKDIATAMGGSLFEGSAVVVDCAWQHSSGYLQFVFGESSGNHVIIDVPLAAIVLNDDGMCGLGIQPSDGDIMIMGDTLMRQAYYVFDQDNKYIYMAPFADCGSDEETLPQLSEGEFFSYTGACKTSAFAEETASIASAGAKATATTKGGSTTGATGAAATGTGGAGGGANTSAAGRSGTVSAVVLAAGLVAHLLI
ncbi:hypothetical protein Sste5346_002289 [Sporothrix stenoceras]|uniref:Peptidase A1 domain-containing protein n=1 Tax=Sporothrix stenoceras TaxID=5173 RepID=A0ABR3ZKI8_9PEZI